MAFSALLSCETPTTALRIRIVRICDCENLLKQRGEGCTYNRGIYKSSPATTFFKESQNEGDYGGSKKNNDKLVLELLKDQLP
jgi:hypothetical protein